MNAHNEQHDPACIAAYEQLFQADSRDPSQTERLAVWARSWNAARAAWSSPVVKQNLTTQPAAAQEAVAWQVDDEFYPSESLAIEAIQQWGPSGAIAIPLYAAAPVTAAPADHLHAHLLHMLGAKDHEDAGRIIGELHAATMRNPAAPGIDMGVPGATLTIDGKTFTVDEVRAALIDASPNGALNEQFGSAEGLDSPKGGSEARDDALNTLARMFHNGEEMEGPDGMAVSVDLALWHEASEALDMLIGDDDEEAQAGDAEVQP